MDGHSEVRRGRKAHAVTAGEYGTRISGCSSVGRVLASDARGRGIVTHHPDQYTGTPLGRERPMRTLRAEILYGYDRKELR